VTSESPLLDERKVSKGTTVSQIELEKIPTARAPWAIVTQTPGVLSDRINVGGSESGQQAVFTAPGTTDDENSFAVDGVVITDMAAIGSSPTYYDFDQFEEIQVSTGGTDIEKISAGASLNLVTKRGSNNPRGSARYLLTEADEQFGIFEQATPDIQDELENGDGNGGLEQQTLTGTPGNQINEVVDFGFERPAARSCATSCGSGVPTGELLALRRTALLGQHHADQPDRRPVRVRLLQRRERQQLLRLG